MELGLVLANWTSVGVELGPFMASPVRTSTRVFELQRLQLVKPANSARNELPPCLPSEMMSRFQQATTRTLKCARRVLSLLQRTPPSAR